MNELTIEIGSKIKPIYNSFYMEIVNIFKYDNKEYVAYICHNKDGSIVKSQQYGTIEGVVDTLEHFSQIVKAGRHENYK